MDNNQEFGLPLELLLLMLMLSRLKNAGSTCCTSFASEYHNSSYIGTTLKLNIFASLPALIEFDLG